MKNKKLNDTILITDSYSSIDNDLIKEWEDVWKKSKNAHIFNSPYWYQACINASHPKGLLVLVCRTSSPSLKILGILPLISSRKFGLQVYLSPGGKYLDKSTVLLDENNNADIVFQNLLAELETIGNYYLTELNETCALSIKNGSFKVGISKCSEGFLLPFENDPFRYVSRENNRRLRKRIRDNSQQLKFVCTSENITDNIQTIREIEKESTKKANFKDIFSDQFLTDMCVNFSKLFQGSINFTFLYYDNEPICYKYGFISHGVYHYSNTAYKTKFQKLSPGRLLMYLSLDEFVKHGVNLIDFSRGDTPFKREFTPYSYRQYTLYHINNPILMLNWRLMYFLKSAIEKENNIVELLRINTQKIIILGKKYFENKGINIGVKSINKI